MPSGYIGNELVVYRRKPAEYDPAAFQGIHGGYVLVIIDEADGVPKSIFDAVDALATNVDARVVAVGTPTIRHPTSLQSANRVPVGTSRRSMPSTHPSTVACPQREGSPWLTFRMWRQRPTWRSVLI
jgi:hypothetical protein